MSNPNTTITPEGYHVLTNDTHISRWVEEHKSLICDPYLFKWLLPKLEGVKRIWDVGAFIGDHTAAYLTIPGIEKVHAFEPNSDSYHCLEKNFSGREDCSCWNIAVSDTRERLGFEPAPNAGASRMRETGKSSVTSFALDDFMEGTAPPEFIKIDVEGWEPRALRGMRKTIEAKRPMVFVEINAGALKDNGFSADDIFGFFKELGYTGRKPYPEHATPDQDQYDILFIP